MGALIINGIHCGSTDEGRAPSRRVKHHVGVRFNANALLQREHAYDAEPDTSDDLRSHLRKARNHLAAVRDGSGTALDMDRLDGYLTSAMECLEVPGADSISDMTEREVDKALAKARDSMGETTSSSVVKTGSRTVDHRKDFSSVASGGADSAMFDPDSLFQR